LLEEEHYASSVPSPDADVRIFAPPESGGDIRSVCTSSSDVRNIVFAFGDGRVCPEG
jgi:hypothetical protein